MVRAERTGPTGSVPTEWNTATNRVMSASTTSSNTMSAWFSPVWGSALSTGVSRLSIFTASAGRKRVRMGDDEAGQRGDVPPPFPRRCRGGGGSCGASWNSTGVPFGADRCGLTFVGCSLAATATIAAARTTTATATTPDARCRIVMRPASGIRPSHLVTSELAQIRDPLFQRRVGVEQSVDLRQLALCLGAGHRRLDPEVRGGPGSAVHDGVVVTQLLQR